MFDEFDAASSRELQWLANYYELHGHEKEAEEIKNVLLSRLVRRFPSGEVVEMFPGEEKQA